MKTRPILFCILLSLCAQAAAGPSIFPLDTPRHALSASFGEYRPGHLHAGVDLATFMKKGIPVKAVADGEVYRIRSSVGGYGNVVYIEHADGRRSVYAHLEAFSPKIQSLLPRPPHPLGGDRRGEPMEVYPSGKIHVSAGEIIGRNGESGAGLPHLHFELRDRNDRPINPITCGVLAIEDSVPPVITSITLEPADESSSINGGGAPIVIDSGTRHPVVELIGRCRILVNGYDDDGRAGGRLGLTDIRLHANGQLWSEINMKEFTYGRDKEVGAVYDLYRTGFGPTNYTYDLTGTDGAAEVVKSGGMFEMRDPRRTRTKLNIEVFDMSGNRTVFPFAIIRGTGLPNGQARVRGATRKHLSGNAEIAGLSVHGTHDGRPDHRERDHPAAAHGQDGEAISRGGIIVRRNGVERRITGTETGRIGSSTYSLSRAGMSGPRTGNSIAEGIILSGLAAGQKIFSFTEGSLAPPAQGIGRPLLLGPYGSPLASNSEISIEQSWNVQPQGWNMQLHGSNVQPQARNANGIAFWRNGTWSWLGGSKKGTALVAAIPFLAPVVLVRDTMPPVICFAGEDGDPSHRVVGAGHAEQQGRPEKQAYQPVISITDDFSGIDLESIVVYKKLDNKTTPCEGRYDPDRGFFVPDSPFESGRQTFVVEASDEAGNQTRAEITAVIE